MVTKCLYWTQRWNRNEQNEDRDTQTEIEHHKWNQGKKEKKNCRVKVLAKWWGHRNQETARPCDKSMPKPALQSWSPCSLSYAFFSRGGGSCWEGQLGRRCWTQLLWWLQEEPSPRPAFSNWFHFQQCLHPQTTHFPSPVINVMMPREQSDQCAFNP